MIHFTDQHRHLTRVASMKLPNCQNSYLQDLSIVCDGGEIVTTSCVLFLTHSSFAANLLSDPHHLFCNCSYPGNRYSPFVLQVPSVAASGVRKFLLLLAEGEVVTNAVENQTIMDFMELLAISPMIVNITNLSDSEEEKGGSGSENSRSPFSLPEPTVVSFSVANETLSQEGADAYYVAGEVYSPPPPFIRSMVDSNPTLSQLLRKANDVTSVGMDVGPRGIEVGKIRLILF
jgi:hypothetical protein